MKRRLVVKFGGDALATEERIRLAARHVVYLTKVLGYEVVVVVSAMGNSTDDDLALIRRFNPKPRFKRMAKLWRTGEDRSAALLAAAIEGADPQGKVVVEAPDTHEAGLLVREESSGFRIVRGRGIKAFEQMLRRRGTTRTVLIFSGFQGVTERREVVTLKRGASDLSAECFAKVFRAELCILYKAFRGVAATDPRVVSDVAFFRDLTPDQYLDLVSTGVVMREAVEAAREHGVTLFVGLSPSIDPSAREDFRLGRGTFITAAPPPRELERRPDPIAVLNIPRGAVFFHMPNARPGSAQADKIYDAAARVANLIEEHELQGGVLLVVSKDDAALVEVALRKAYRGVVLRHNEWVMLALADRRMAGTPGYVVRLRSALRRRRVRIIGGWSAGHQIIRIIHVRDLTRGACALAREFGLLDRSEGEGA